MSKNEEQSKPQKGSRANNQQVEDDLESQKKAPTTRVIQSLDEFGVSKRLFKAYKERLRYQTDAQSVLAWDG